MLETITFVSMVTEDGPTTVDLVHLVYNNKEQQKSLESDKYVKRNPYVIITLHQHVINSQDVTLYVVMTSPITSVAQ